MTHSLEGNTKKGLGIATLGGVMLACDIPLVRLAETDPWTTLVVRGPLMLFAILLASQIIRRMGLSKARFYEGRDTLILACLHATATIGFVFGIFHTTTANLVFITAFSSLFALVLGTVFLKEHHSRATWITVLVALTGIVIITGNDLIVHEGRNTFGNMMALLCAVMLACEVVFIRRSKKNLVYAPGLAALIAGVFALPFLLLDGASLGKPHFLIINALFVAPLAMALLTLAPRYMPAPEAAMFYLLETVLAPLFVWIIFAEIPTPNTLFGGSIVIGALLFHSYRKIRQNTVMTNRTT